MHINKCALHKPKPKEMKGILWNIKFSYVYEVFLAPLMSPSTLPKCVYWDKRWRFCSVVLHQDMVFYIYITLLFHFIIKYLWIP